MLLLRFTGKIGLSLLPLLGKLLEKELYVKGEDEQGKEAISNPEGIRSFD